VGGVLDHDLVRRRGRLLVGDGRHLGGDRLVDDLVVRGRLRDDGLLRDERGHWLLVGGVGDRLLRGDLVERRPGRVLRRRGLIGRRHRDDGLSCGVRWSCRLRVPGLVGGRPLDQGFRVGDGRHRLVVGHDRHVVLLGGRRLLVGDRLRRGRVRRLPGVGQPGRVGVQRRHHGQRRVGRRRVVLDRRHDRQPRVGGRSGHRDRTVGRGQHGPRPRRVPDVAQPAVVAPAQLPGLSAPAARGPCGSSPMTEPVGRAAITWRSAVSRPGVRRAMSSAPMRQVTRAISSVAAIAFSSGSWRASTSSTPASARDRLITRQASRRRR
jgi:hypothetical protein